MGQMSSLASHDPDLGQPSTVAPHGHQASLAVGLAFINTQEVQRGRVIEHLPSFEVALRWLRGHQLLHQEALEAGLASVVVEPSTGDRALARIHRVRAAMRELADATVEHRPPDARHLGRINRSLRTPYSYILVPAADGVSMDHRHEGDPVEGAMARLVESLSREVSQGHPDRIRVCANEECRWVFHDTSRSGRRKWCDMSTCGNRAKVARHREKRKAGSGEAGLGSPTPEVAAQG
jgi:predicted RNA-binding Zn ribbon-like protein